HQKKTAESMVLDECQFLREPSHRLVTLLGTLRIARFEHRPTQLGERLRGGAPIRPAEVREPVAQVPGDVERPAALPQRPRVGDSIWTVTKQRSDIFRSPKVELAVRPPHAVRAVQRRALPAPD